MDISTLCDIGYHERCVDEHSCECGCHKKGAL